MSKLSNYINTNDFLASLSIYLSVYILLFSYDISVQSMKHTTLTNQDFYVLKSNSLLISHYLPSVSLWFTLQQKLILVLVLVKQNTNSNNCHDE